jgi:hypothetical protein
MVARKTALSLALMASAALALPGAQAMATGPVAHSAGGDAPPLNPSVVGTAITRTDSALGAAADAVDAGDGATAAKPLTAARRYLIRSYVGAKYLIAHPPAAPADDASASAMQTKFVKRARSLVRSSHRGRRYRSRWIRAHKSDDPTGPTIADNPTAVFNVFTSQYNAATAAIGMYPDTTGTLQNKVKLVLNTAIILRNRLVKIVHAAEPAPAADARAHAHSSGGAVATTYAPVMPGLVVLLDDEIQSLTAGKSGLPAGAQADFDKAIAADQKIEALVNLYWPPAAD